MSANTASSTRRPRPLKPITTGQLRALHAIAKRREWSHEELREIAGVASLKDLSVGEAAKLIERVQLPDHQREFTPGEPDRAKARNVIRPATERQRTYIATLLEELGWNRDKATGWLKKRHAIHDLAGGIFSSAAASQVILELEAALAKGCAPAASEGGSGAA